MKTKNKITIFLTILLLYSIKFSVYCQDINKYYYYYEGKKIIIMPSDEKFTVKFKSSVPPQRKVDFVKSKDLELLGEGGPFNLGTVRITSKGRSKYQILEELRNTPEIEFAHHIFIWSDGVELSLNNQLIVCFKSTQSENEINTIVTKYGAKKIQKFDMPGNHFLLEILWDSKYNSLELSNLLYENGEVEYASPNFGLVIKPCFIPNDPYYSNQWALTKINASNAWNITQGSSSIKIAIIDEGVDLVHEDLSDNIISGTDKSGQGDLSPQPATNDAHGTACAGIAAARTNNSLGISGLAGNCKIMPVQMAWNNPNDPNYSYNDWIMNGINWATNNGADVLSCSWTTPSYDGITTAINHAVNDGRNGKGCVVVFASGNYNTSVAYPANLSNVIAVGATNENDQRCTSSDWGGCSGAGSNYGPELSVTAPGNNIWTTDNSDTAGFNSHKPQRWCSSAPYITEYSTNNNYTSTFAGTSAATPFVAGLAALILSQNSNLIQSQVRTIIEQSADDLGTAGKDDYYGWGRINAYNALRITTSGTLPGNEVWRGTVSLTDSVFVPSGKKLTILSGSTINLNGYRVKSTGGTITATGSFTCNPSIKIIQGNNIIGLYSDFFTPVREVISGQSLVVVGGNYYPSSDIYIGTGITLDISNAIFTFSGTNVKLYVNGGRFLATNTTFQGNGSIGSWYGIKIDNSTGPLLSSINFCTIKDAQYGVYVYNGYAAVRNCIIRNCNRGANYSYYATGDIGPSCVFSWNNWDVYGDNTSVPSPGGSVAGYISFRNPGYYQVYSSYSGTIYARGNYWGTCPYYPIVTNNVDYSNYLCSDPNPKITNIKDDVAIGTIILSKKDVKSNTTIPLKTEPGMENVDKAYLLYLDGKYSDALSGFEKITAEFPDNFAGNISLVFMERCLEKLDRSGEIFDRLSTVSQNNAGKGISKFADARKVYQYLSQGKINEAAEQSKNVLNTTQDTTLIKMSLYDLGTMYWYDLKDMKTGELYFSELIKNYPYDQLSEIALVTLGEWKPKANDLDKSAVSSKVVSSDILSQNFPNPFNPSTVISYKLPVNSFVTLKIFDILGKEVSTLVNEYKGEGNYSTEFNANKLASGTYFYRLVITPNNGSKNIVVQKSMQILK